MTTTSCVGPTAPNESASPIARVDFPASDREVYCFLKAQLPQGYRIESEPSTQYFSEWLYCYRIYAKDKEIACWRGDYRTLSPGVLMAQAHDLLNSLDIDLPC